MAFHVVVSGFVFLSACVVLVCNGFTKLDFFFCSVKSRKNELLSALTIFEGIFHGGRLTFNRIIIPLRNTLRAKMC